MYFKALTPRLALCLALFGLTFACGDASEDHANDDPVSASDPCDPTDTSDGSDPSTTSNFSPNDLLHHVGHEIILPTYAAFETAANELVTSLDAYLTDLEVGNDAVDSLAQARTTWSSTMIVWQQAEVYQVGPSASRQALELAVGAMGLRNEIYSWPTVNSCRVDQEILEAAYTNTDFFDQELTNVYGLDAAEYLLFYHEADNTCPPLVPINSQGTWNQVSQEDLQQKRAEYVHAVATNIHDRAIELHNAWKPNSGNFVNDFATAGQPGSLYVTTEEALNDLSDALFYVEKDVKDFKLAKPAGILGCQNVSCPNDVEARFSRVSKENIIANLEAAQKLFLGAAPGEDAPGFDDFLREKDPSDIADTMGQNLEQAIQAAKEMDGTLYEAALTLTREECEAGNDPICNTYYTLKNFTDDLKTRFVEVLELQLPLEASGDAD
ncbi:MAG: imelysin family protein [Deltaproteobacteria bacterium]|jgi:uncharacterized protein|nr:imelysin family protein [Deltaproteobacteria bacterium]MBT6434436.1 imelysin family protein [Deltaproteobacteria bacterium]